MMQRDEGTMLMAWLSYYGRLFGFQNLTIFDNGSSDPFTLHLLAQARRCGATVRYDRDDPSDFHGKGLHFAEQIREWDRIGAYDFALPVDCDEFLAVVGDEGISTSPDMIMQEFVSHANEKRSLRIATSLFNIPARPGWFAVDSGFYKGFVPAHSVGVVDNGQHNPSSVLAPGYALTRFTYLHWHNHEYDEMQRRARRKLANSLVDPNDHEALFRYAATPNLPGRHLVNVLLENEAHYLARYEGLLQVYIPWAKSPSALPNHLEDGPVFFRDHLTARPWRAESYKAAQPDVGEWSPGPLMHYLLHGWAEGRGF